MIATIALHALMSAKNVLRKVLNYSTIFGVSFVLYNPMLSYEIISSPTLFIGLTTPYKRACCVHLDSHATFGATHNVNQSSQQSTNPF
jgi:hypothetical protein